MTGHRPTRAEGTARQHPRCCSPLWRMPRDSPCSSLLRWCALGRWRTHHRPRPRHRIRPCFVRHPQPTPPPASIRAATPRTAIAMMEARAPNTRCARLAPIVMTAVRVLAACLGRLRPCHPATPPPCRPASLPLCYRRQMDRRRMVPQRVLTHASSAPMVNATMVVVDPNSRFAPLARTVQTVGRKLAAYLSRHRYRRLRRRRRHLRAPALPTSPRACTGSTSSSTAARMACLAGRLVAFVVWGDSMLSAARCLSMVRVYRTSIGNVQRPILRRHLRPFSRSGRPRHRHR